MEMGHALFIDRIVLLSKNDTRMIQMTDYSNEILFIMKVHIGR